MKAMDNGQWIIARQSVAIVPPVVVTVEGDNAIAALIKVISGYFF
jgi:hypothetical protein